MGESACDPSPAALATWMVRLREEMRVRHVELAPTLERVHPSHRRSATNLVDYLTLRHHDVRPLQESLAEMGLSSLGRSEEHVMHTLERVLGILQMLAGKAPDVPTPEAVDHGEGRGMLESNAEALLGPSPQGRPTRIIVTMPSEAADDIGVVRGLIESGMDGARINCAHDDEDRWLRMVGNLRRAAGEAGRRCPIVMDLPGPKLRTGPVEAGPQVMRLRPRRDAWGRTIAPARAVLVAQEHPMPEILPDGPAAVPVPDRWRSSLRPGDRIKLHDARGSSRRLTVTEVRKDGILVDAYDTTYLATGTHLIGPQHHETAVGPILALEQFLTLRSGDVLTLAADLSPASPEGVELAEVQPATGPGRGAAHRMPPRRYRIGCTLPRALESVRIGHRVFLDDGKIGGRVIALRSEEADVRITMAAPGGTKLRAEKGINFPDSDLSLPAMTPEDEARLPFIVEHADLVELSFAQSPSDVTALQERLAALGGSGLGVVLKVETARGFAQLPEMLLAGMASERLGVMVARGDLAVECGFERLAEVQEEMLWLCDAAHVPVIWATQVLDQLAHTGHPSRAEISDAAMAGRAECVLLNKGPYIAHAVAALDDILRRMASHQHKKVALLRRLRSWSPNPG